MLLQQSFDLLTSQGQLHKRVAERLDFGQIAEGYITFRKISADTARIHEGKVSGSNTVTEIRLSHRIGNQVTQCRFIVVCIRLSDCTVSSTNWLSQFRMILQIVVDERHSLWVRGYPFLVSGSYGCGLFFYIASCVVNDELNVFKSRTVRVRLENQLTVYFIVGICMVITGHNDINRRICRKRLSQINSFACRYVSGCCITFGSSRIMRKHDDRFYTLVLKFFCIFLNSFYFFSSGQEFHAGCSGRRYLAWSSLGHNADESDFYAAHFFDDVRVNDRLAGCAVHRVGIDIIKIRSQVGYVTVLRIDAAENLCLQCSYTLVKLMVTQSSYIKAHHVHPHMSRLIAFQRGYRCGSTYRVPVVEEQGILIFRAGFLQVGCQNSRSPYSFVTYIRSSVQLTVEVVDPDKVNFDISGWFRCFSLQVKVIHLEAFNVLSFRICNIAWHYCRSLRRRSEGNIYIALDWCN
ncbi:hypothetical protein D3C73_897330 [compost metagenome]